jgi:hypothetical protein
MLLFMIYYLTMQLALTLYTIGYVIQITQGGHSILGYEICETSDLITYFIFTGMILN